MTTAAVVGSLSFPVFNRIGTFWKLKQELRADTQQLASNCRMIRSGFERSPGFLSATDISGFFVEEGSTIANTLGLLLIAHEQFIGDDGWEFCAINGLLLMRELNLIGREVLDLLGDSEHLIYECVVKSRIEERNLTTIAAVETGFRTVRDIVNKAQHLALLSPSEAMSGVAEINLGAHRE